MSQSATANSSTNTNLDFLVRDHHAPNGTLLGFWLYLMSDCLIFAALFAALSPILKIPHEFGHAFTARYFNIPLHSAGIVFVGFFPLPFVDASPADVFASRSQRIRISSAGIFVDLIIALIAIIIWHLVEGEFAKTIFASIFTFSSLNSLLFNGNPFIRLDGYYVFSDWIGPVSYTHLTLPTNREV